MHLFSKPSKSYYVSVGLSVISAVFVVTLVAYAATTIGNNISTDGTLSITGASTLTGTLTGAGTVNFTGTSATTTISGGLLVDTTTFIVDYSTNRVGVGTTSPGQELGISGDTLHASGATTTIIIDSTAGSTGGCIQLRGANGTTFRIYAGATTTNSGQLMVESGACQ